MSPTPPLIGTRIDLSWTETLAVDRYSQATSDARWGEAAVGHATHRKRMRLSLAGIHAVALPSSAFAHQLTHETSSVRVRGGVRQAGMIARPGWALGVEPTWFVAGAGVEGFVRAKGFSLFRH